MADNFDDVGDDSVTDEEWARVLGDEPDCDNLEPDKGRSTEGYDVGFRKPPQHTQFKPGQSGNPKGRPKGKTENETRRDLRSMVWKASMTPVATVIDGQRQTVPALQAVYYKSISKAIEGHAPSIRFAHELARGALQEHEASQLEMFTVAWDLIEQLDSQPEGQKDLETIRLLNEVMDRVNVTLSEDDE